MNQTVVQIPMTGLLLAIVLVVVIMIGLLYRISVLTKDDKKSIDIPFPFSEPRPGPAPVPPMLIPTGPVVPAADPKIRPIRYAYDQTIFERYYVPYSGQVCKWMVGIEDEVKKGDVLMRVRCMKTECEVRASAKGKIRTLNYKEGETFQKGDLLYVIQ